MQWFYSWETIIILKLFYLLEIDIGNDIFIGGVNAGSKDCQISDFVSPHSTLNLTPLGWKSCHFHELFTGKMSNMFWGVLSSRTEKLKKSYSSLAVGSL